jgi:hypothetical protein
MSLIEKRVSECFWLFGNILPIGENQTKKLVEAFGEDVSKMLPELFAKKSKISMTYPEEFNGYLEFILQSIKYMRGETDSYPDIDVSDYDKMIQAMRIQLGTFKSKET